VSEMPTMYRASTYIPAFATGQTLPKNSYACPNWKAALLSLCQSNPKYMDRLSALLPSEWRKLLRWLDASGLSLYFADRVDELNLQHSLPLAVRQRLQQNLSDNRACMRGLLKETVELQAEFQRANVSHAVLNGFSLCPSSMPMSELGHQLAVEFLIDESGVTRAREILEQAGYCLHGIGEGTWEFKKNETRRLSTKNMYKDGFGHTVKLHVETVLPSRKPVLSRLEYRKIEGSVMPALSPPDLFLRQGMEVFEDVCNSSVRASDLFEFYCNVCAHSEDAAFWSRVRELAEDEPITVFGLGVVLQLIESVMEGEVPSKLAMWTMLRLPAAALRWVDIYGLNCVRGTPCGAKLYLLLQRESMKAGSIFASPAKTVLLSTRLRLGIRGAKANDTLTFRVQRSALQLRCGLRWLRLHLAAGFRYGWGCYRWQRYRNELSA
jgi:hypothetical protein